MIDIRTGNVIFRADGNSVTGLGHIIRSCALASAINSDYNCILATRCSIIEVLKEAASVFSNIIRLSEKDYYLEAECLSEISSINDLIILDGYFFDSEYQQKLKRQGYEFFSIDDIHSTQFFSKVIINPGGGLTPFDYKAMPGTQFYLGPHYALLRPAFLKASKERRTAIDNKNCFICFGGADPKNKTLEIIRTSILTHFDQIHLVIGSAYQYKKELIEFTNLKKNVFVYSALPPEELSLIMQKCCFAICSPSTVLYEYLSVGGIVFLEQIADNQKDAIKYMTEAGLAFLINDIGRVNGEKFQVSLEKQSLYFDGESNERFRKIFRHYFDSKKMMVRKAEKADLEICFKWANDKLIRNQSYNQNPISLREHTVWFNEKLNDPNSFFYIIEIDQKPVGQIRFQVTDNEAVLGYLADESIRNKGLGVSILSRGIERFIKDLKTSILVTGYVKYSNLPSQSSFEKLGFLKTNSTEHSDSFKYTMYYDNKFG